MAQVVGHIITREGPVLSANERALLIRRVVDEWRAIDLDRAARTALMGGNALALFWPEESAVNTGTWAREDEEVGG